MGALILPANGDIYTDTQTIIYTVQKNPTYAAVLRPLWAAAIAGQLTVFSSDLTLMETLVLPLRIADTALQEQFERFLLNSDVILQPITQEILREVARLRAAVSGLKTPDAIHAATALLAGCSLFVTNDFGLRNVPGLNVAVLDDVIAAP